MKNRNTFKFLFATVLIGGSFAASAMETDANKTVSTRPYSDSELKLALMEYWHYDLIYPVLPDGVEVNGPHHNDIGLLVAATLGEIPRIELYLAQGANINFQDKLGRTPLMLAALKKHADAVDLLIKSKANLEIKKLDGATALMCSTNNLPCLRLLIDAGANINALDNKGHNAFSRKMYVSSSKKIATCLIEAGSDILPAIKTRDSETANPFELTSYIGEFLRFNRTQREKVPALLWCLKNALQNDNKIDPMLSLVLAEYLFDAQTDANEQTIRDGINSMKTEMWKQLLLETLNKESN